MSWPNAWRAPAVLSLLALLAAPAIAPAHAETAPTAPAGLAPASVARTTALPVVNVYDLPRILALAERNHPNIAASRARLLQARAQLDEARFTPYSQFKLTGGVALAPTIRGNNVFSPNTDVSLTSSLAVA